MTVPTDYNEWRSYAREWATELIRLETCHGLAPAGATKLLELLDDRDALARKVEAMQDKIIEAKTQMLTTIHGHCVMDDCSRPSEPFRYWLNSILNAVPEATNATTGK